jgi:broad specificity phosphatase PhoE
MALSVPAGITLYFCRHGQTEANAEKRFQGRTRDTALTPLGVQQAQAIAAIMQHNAPDFANLAFVASPLPRARRTMEIVRTDLGLPADGYATDDRLMEIDLGAWDGLTDEEARARFPKEFVERGNDKWNVRVPGGENYEDVAGRATSWIRDLKADTFAVAHGAFTRILRGLFAGATWRQMSDLDEPQGVVFRVRGNTVKRFNPK